MLRQCLTVDLTRDLPAAEHPTAFPPAYFPPPLRSASPCSFSRCARPHHVTRFFVLFFVETFGLARRLVTIQVDVNQRASRLHRRTSGCGSKPRRSSARNKVTSVSRNRIFLVRAMEEAEG